LFSLLKLTDSSLSAQDHLQILREIRTDPPCLRDPFTRAFFATSSTERELSSPVCLSVLQAIATILRLCVSRIECRHSAIRRILIARGSSWLAELHRCSAQWLLIRQRVIESAKETSKTGADAIASQREPLPEKRPAPGGGPYRAFLSEFMSDPNYRKQFDKAEMLTEAASAYEQITNASGAEWERLVKLGHAGTLAACVGAPAFGPKVRSARRNLPLHDDIASQAVGPSDEQPVVPFVDEPLQLVVSRLAEKAKEDLAADRNARSEEG
jgi:hypothetical protein